MMPKGKKWHFLPGLMLYMTGFSHSDEKHMSYPLE